MEKNGNQAMTFTFYRDKAKKWRWKLTAGNHEIICASTQGFSRKLDCKINCELTFDGLRESKLQWDTYRDDEARG